MYETSPKDEVDSLFEFETRVLLRLADGVFYPSLSSLSTFLKLTLDLVASDIASRLGYSYR